MTSTHPTPLHPPIPPFLTYIHPTSPSAPAPAPLIRRVDTPHLLLHTSLHLASLPHPDKDKISTSPSLIAPHTTIHASTTLIAPNTSIATHCVVKSSVVGANCVIGEGARLTGCLLMDGVSVGERSVLQGCILGRRCVVGRGSSLKECEVQEGYRVEEETEAKGEKMMVFEGLDEAGTEEEEGGEGIAVGEE